MALIPQKLPTLELDPEESRVPDDGQRAAQYATWRSFAGGAQWPSKPGPVPRADQQVYNYAAALVRKVASYTFGGALKYEIPKPEGSAIADEAIASAERRLSEIQRDLALDDLDLRLEVERSIIGDAAVKVTWDVTTKRPAVVAIDPANVSVIWSPADPHTPIQVAHTYAIAGAQLAGYVRGGELLDPRRLYTAHEVWSAQEWQLSVDGITVDAPPTPNPYGWLPFVFLPNDPHPRRFWGRSDLAELQDVAMAFNRELATLGAIMRLSGAPIAVFEGVDGTDNISASPGAKWEIPEGGKAYLLDLLQGQGVRLHIEYLGELRRTMHDLSETPRTAFGDSGRSLSGVALEVEIQPLVQRVRRKRSGWDRFHRERNWRLLDLEARFGSSGAIGELRTTTTVWPPILPSDEDSTTRNVVQLVAQNVISRRTGMVRLGETDPESEFAQILDELEELHATEPVPLPQPGTQNGNGPDLATQQKQEAAHGSA